MAACGTTQAGNSMRSHIEEYHRSFCLSDFVVSTTPRSLMATVKLARMKNKKCKHNFGCKVYW
jgi:hypothetical protein